MAPEMFTNNKNCVYYGEKHDIFSAGVTLFCMKTAAHPWGINRDDTPKTVDDEGSLYKYIESN